MTDYGRRFDTIDTNLVHAGSPEPPIEGAVVSPLFQSANYVMSGEATYDAVRYIRLSNSPSHLTLQARLAAVESGEAALVTASGMAAISSALMAFLGRGDHLLVQKTIYGGTQSFLDEDAPRFGIGYTAIDVCDPRGQAAWAESVTADTKLVYVESISNPLMEVGDLEAIVAFARTNDLVTVIDNTFASPINFRPLEVGFDVVVHSATKYLNGHSDIVAGAVVGARQHVDRIRHLLLHLGGSLDPHTCFLFERGLKTLALRVRRQNDTALRLAGALEAHPGVERVRYPGLPSDPGHAIAGRLFSGFGGMLSFTCGGLDKALQVLERLRIPYHAASLGGLESLVVRPAESSHLGLDPETRSRIGISDDLIRVSVGIEDPDELIEDFSQALA